MTPGTEARGAWRRDMTDGASPSPVAAIVCSSITGNTRRLAEALSAAATAPVHHVSHAPRLPREGVLLLGFWVRRGQPDSRSLRFWQGLRGRRVFVFGTHGTRPGSAHSRQSLAAACRLLRDNGNEVLGGFVCQGRVNPRLVALAGKPGHHAMTPGRAARLAEAARHPDGADLAALLRCWEQCRQGQALPGADTAGALDGGHFFAWSAGREESSRDRSL